MQPSQSKMKLDDLPEVALERLVDPTFAAAFLCVGIRTLRRLIADGVLRTVPMGRVKRIKLRSLMELAAEGIDKIPHNAGEYRRARREK